MSIPLASMSRAGLTVAAEVGLTDDVAAMARATDSGSLPNDASGDPTASLACPMPKMAIAARLEKRRFIGVWRDVINRYTRPMFVAFHAPSQRDVLR